MDVYSVRGEVGNRLSFSDCVAGDGLARTLDMKAEDVLEAVTKSGLRGRGGAGFPTGMKWKFAREQAEKQKYIVCNADEGEPGTFKDRLILTDFPELVIEGMAIAGIIVGATKGIIYLRGEYAYMRSHLENAIESCRKKHIIGNAINSNPDLSFEVEIRMGMGAYVCGEETALLESLEGRRGEPRNRFPFPVESGYLGKPTVINNVETFAWVPCILSKGVDWFSSVGTEQSKGLRLFSISGDCEKPGIYEYAFGTPLSKLASDVGAKKTKAALVGGASGICVPACEFNRVLAFEDLATGGSIIFFGENQDMFAIAENIQAFFAEEGCGQCTPCRIGNVRLLDIIEQIKEKGMSESDVEKIKELSITMQTASKCGLGQTAPNALLSIVEHFGDELVANG